MKKRSGMFCLILLMFVFVMSIFLTGCEEVPQEVKYETLTPKDYYESKDKDLISNYTQKELNEIKEGFESKEFKERIEIYKEETLKIFDKKRPDLKFIERRKMVDGIFKDSKITSSYLGKIGNSKAYIIEFKIGESFMFRKFYITSLNGVTVVEVCYNSNGDIDSLKEYKSFVNSFKSKGTAPTWFNHFLYGIIGPNFVRLLIIVVIGVGGTFLKKRNG